MDYVTLGRTGLRVSVAGLGGGGHSRLGLVYGKTEDEAADLVRRALDLGVNFLDTAANYGTEAAMGKALAGRDRSQVVVCTKTPIRRKTGQLLDGPSVTASVHASLVALRLDCIDVLYLHGVTPEEYDHCVAEILPALAALRAAGKIRFIGITESFSADTAHAMLERAVQDSFWDVIMVGFNLLNPSARKRVLPGAQARNIGVVDMFAVRRALCNPASLQAIIARLTVIGHNELAGLAHDNPLGFLVQPGAAESLTDAGYRFCRHEPGVHVVLFGTGNPVHLEHNVASLLRPPLPAAALDALQRYFGNVATESGN